MYLVVGLGNPGGKYSRTRHNAGFDVVELLAHRLNAPLTKLKCKALLAETQVEGERVVLAQPQTFMNLSGESVRELIGWYKVPTDRLIVVYDDIDLMPGALRVRPRGSAGTHNGMRSIIYLLGRDDFPRVRVGIGQAPSGWDLADWVLSGYRTSEERQLAFDGYQDAADTVLELIRHGVDSANRLASERVALRYPKPEKPKKEGGDDRKSLFSDIGRHAWDRIRAGSLSGASCLVTIGGETAFQGIFGQADVEKGSRLRKDSLFRLASMTKPVTAASAMILNERGKLDLDAPVYEVLPEMKDVRLRDGSLPRRAITARHLLTHSSGLAQEEGGAADHEATLQGIVKRYARLPLDFEPGSRAVYSPAAGFDVLARMVESLSGLPFADFVRLALFEPLGMEDTSWFPTEAQWSRVVVPCTSGDGQAVPVDMGRLTFGDFPANCPRGGVGLIGSLSDYSRFARMLLGLGELDGARVLEEKTVREMISPQLFPESTENVGPTETWGLGVRVITAREGDRQPLPVGSFGWSGAYGTHFWADPSHRLTAVYMSSMTDAGGADADTAREFERDVMNALAKGGAQ